MLVSEGISRRTRTQVMIRIRTPIRVEVLVRMILIWRSMVLPLILRWKSKFFPLSSDGRVNSLFVYIGILEFEMHTLVSLYI